MRIGIYSPNWIGDAVMALPFIEQLRIKYKKAEIIIFCKKWVSAIYENHSAIDRVISVSDQELRGPISTIRAGLELRAEKLDVFYTLTDSIRSAFIMWLSGSKQTLWISFADEINIFNRCILLNRIQYTPL